MKKHLLVIGVLAALFTACGKDEITTSDGGETPGTIIDTDTTTTLEGYTRSVTVVFSATGAATVSGDSAGISATIDGNGVEINNESGATVAYFLSGSTTDGYLKIYSNAEQALVLNSVSLANSTGAAINIQGPAIDPGNGLAAKVILNGSNTLADGATYSAASGLEDEKAALFCEGGLLLTGTGSLTVEATGKSAITSDTYVQLSGTPTITARASNGHGVRGKNYILLSGGTLDVRVTGDMRKGLTSDTLVRIDGGTTTIEVSGNSGYDTESAAYAGTAGIRAGLGFVMNGGTLTIANSGRGGKGINSNGDGTFNGGTVDISVTGTDYTTSTDTVAAKGIKFQGDITFGGGTVTVRCNLNEGIESKGSITVSGGEVYGYSATSNAINASNRIAVSSGYLCGHSDSNDGLDAGGDITVSGGLVYAICTDGGTHKAVNSGKGYSFTHSGGTLIAIGGLENGADLKQAGYQTATYSGNTWYALTVGTTTYAFRTPVASASSLVLSCGTTPTLLSGVSVSGGTGRLAGTVVEDGTATGGTTVNLTAYTSNN